MLKPHDLECENTVDPIGVEKETPTLRWLLRSFDQQIGAKQSAFEIGVSSDPEKLGAGSFDLWSSGKISSSQTSIKYAGKSQGFGRPAYWKIRVWDNSGNTSDWSKPALWVQGLSANRDWHARWIGSPVPFNRDNPMPIFRKALGITQPIKQAIIFFCGLGHAELTINGTRITEDVLEPAWSMYDKHALYVGHDVTSYLNAGDNVLAFRLGQGMYNVVGQRYKKFKRSFGPHRLIAQLHLHLADGSTQLIGTDETWRTTEGPLTYSCIFGGEDYDPNRESVGWEKPGFDDSSWDKVTIVEDPVGKLSAQLSPPIRIQKHYSPIKTTPMPDGRKVVDFGQNMSGWPTLSVSGPRGSQVTIRTGELLDNDGFPNQRHTGSPVSYRYTLKGEGIETWRPRFSYTGFRYIDITAPQDVTVKPGADFIYSSVPIVGEFECSSDLINRIHTLINLAIRSNFNHVLSDCPHREKLGWLEQLHLMQPSVMWNYDMRTFAAKACRDIRDSQWADGGIPTIAPEYTQFKNKDGTLTDFSNSPEWGAAGIMTPWQAYEQYGDVSILEDNFQMMTRYVDYLTSHSKDGVIEFGLADWYDIGPGDHGFSKLTSKALTGTAIYYRCARAVADSARVLGRRDVAEKYDKLADAIKAGFNRRLFDPVKVTYDKGSQCACAMALAMGLVPEEHRPAILKNLIDDIRSHDNHITAGDIGFRYVLDALSEAGRSDVIFDLITPATPPSYGSQLAAGATTLTEAWDAAPKNSQNHLMLGHAEAWFWEELAGLKINLAQSSQPYICVAPKLIGDITWVNAIHRSVLGEIKIHWRKQDNRVLLDLTIPPNQKAVLQLPDNKGLEIISAETGALISTSSGDLSDPTNKRVVESGHYFIKFES